MKFFSSFFAFLLPLLAVAEEPIHLTCVTEFPTTSFLIEQKGEEVVARVIHHNGMKYQPLWSSTITPNDLSMLEERASVMNKLSTDMSFRWPRKNCVKHGEFRFECFGTSDVQTINGLKVEPYALYTSLVSHDNLAGKYEELKVYMSYDINGKGGFSTEMNYPLNPFASCVPRALESRLP